MSRIQWSALLLIVLVGGLVAPAARSEEQPALAGVYLCEGTDPTGSEYRGFVRIAGHRDTLVLTWMFPDRAERGALRPSAVGVGIANGGSLSVSYYSATMAGLIVYRVEQEHQRLVGEWTVPGGDGTLYSEVLTRLAAEVIAPNDGAADTPRKPTPPARGNVAL